MNKEKIRNALELLVRELSNGELVIVEESALLPSKTTGKAEPEISGVDLATEVPEDVKAEAKYTLDELNAMKVNELRTIAKEMGVSTKGSKSAIAGRIMEAYDQEPNEEETEEVKVEPEAEVEENDVEETEEDPIQSALEELSVEELADLCTECELSAKGKKQALIGRLVNAHESGDIDLTDFFEEDGEETDEAPTEEEEDVSFDDILEGMALKDIKTVAKAVGVKVALKDKKPALIEKLQGADEEKLFNALVDIGVIEPTDEVTEEVEEESDGIEMPKFIGSDKRKAKCKEIWEDTMKSLEDGEIEEADIREFFEDRFKGNKSELKKIKNTDWEDLAIEYAEIVANLVDDDGEEMELEEPYMVDETPYCCGVPMKKVDDTYICEIDGQEVELED